MEDSYHVPKRWIVMAVLSVILTLILGYRFIESAFVGLSQEKVAYLRELSAKNSTVVREQVDGYFSTLEALSTVIGSEDTFCLDFAQRVLAQEAAKGRFLRMGFITPDGIAHTNDGYTIDFGDRWYFHEAMAGRNAVSDSLIDKLGGGAINVFASPVVHKGEIVGVIFATNAQKTFSESLQTDSFDGKGYSYLISSNGVPIVQPIHADRLDDYSDFDNAMRSYGLAPAQLATVRSQMAAGVDGMLTYQRAGVSWQMSYAPVGINHWYIFSVVPSQVISLQSDRLIRNLLFLILLMLALAIVIPTRMMRLAQRNSKQLLRIAYTDDVTGCSNWAGFRLEATRLLHEHTEQPYAMVAFDINKFKLINDLFGYQRGNELLAHISGVLARSIGKDEAFCRAAADLFNLLLRYESDEEILRRLSLIETELEGCIENYKLKITAGVCTISERALDISSHCDKANLSRNLAKKQNSVSCHFFKDENRLELLREKEIENVMDAALENGEFLTYLQPKYLTLTGAIVGAEALARWKRPGEQLMPPCVFIPLFEKNGFIRKLDLYMFESVCRLLAQWMREYPNAAPFSVSVNISRVHLSNPNLPADLRRIAESYGVPPNLLEIELTESAIFQNMEDMRALMAQIKEAGFLLS
ncbi:MAG: EAL domain-containing protein, partial [Clostridia bacterium]